MYKRTKFIQVTVTALIPLTPAILTLRWADIEAWATLAAALLGFVALLCEALLQLNQWQQNWIGYRSTCEALKHEKFLFLGQAGPYRDIEDPLPILADRIEGLISQEHAKWISVQETAARRMQDKIRTPQTSAAKSGS